MAIDLLRITGDLALSAVMADTSAGKGFSRKFGSQSIPATDISITYGTGNAQCNWMYYASRTVTATTADNLDLYGSLTDAFGTTINATYLKVLAVAISSPDGTKKLQVGPRGVANTNQLAFGGTGATVYVEVYDWQVVAFNPYTGFAVTNASTDVVGIYNPGAGSVTYSILMAGI
jgi:hypothetical protein